MNHPEAIIPSPSQSEILRKEKTIPRKPTPTDPKKKFLYCAHAALDKKADNLVILEVKKLSSFADYFLICEGQSSRQVRGIAKHIEERMKEAGFRPLGVEGLKEGQWVLMDYGDVIAHIFLKPVREYFDLERLWVEAPRLEVDTGKE